MKSSNNQQNIIGIIMSNPRIKWWLIVTGIFFLALIASAVVLWEMALHSAPAATTKSSSIAVARIVATGVCGTDLIKQANAPLANSDQIALGQVTGKITALKNYDHDPNCLYIVLMYNIAAGDPTASQSLMDKFSQVYDPAIGLSSAFTVTLIPLDTLKSDVAFLLANSKNATNQKIDNSDVSQGSDTADKFYQGQK